MRNGCITLCLRPKNVIPHPAGDPPNWVLVTSLKPQRPPEAAVLLLGSLGLNPEETRWVSPSRMTLAVSPDQQLRSPGAHSAGAVVPSAAGQGRSLQLGNHPACPACHPPHGACHKLMGCDSRARITAPTNALSTQPFA